MSAQTPQPTERVNSESKDYTFTRLNETTVEIGHVKDGVEVVTQRYDRITS